MKLKDILNEIKDGSVKFKIKTDEDRTEISIPNIGVVIVTETTPGYEFMEYIGEDALEDMGLSEDDFIGKIEHLEVEDSYKGQGYAKLLMDEAIKFARTNGMMPLYLNASPMGSSGLDSSSLPNFYKRFGFNTFLDQGHNKLMILEK